MFEIKTNLHATFNFEYFDKPQATTDTSVDFRPIDRPTNQLTDWQQKWEDRWTDGWMDDCWVKCMVGLTDGRKSIWFGYSICIYFTWQVYDYHNYQSSCQDVNTCELINIFRDIPESILYVETDKLSLPTYIQWMLI